MKDVIVVSAITHRQGMIDEYEDQLAAAGIDYYFHPIALDNGIVSITARWKFKFIREMCEKFSDYERIIFTDAWDVLFYGTKEDLLQKVTVRPVVSTERNCWPEGNLKFKYELKGPWKYCNAGMICGPPIDLRCWVEHELSLNMPNLELMEQMWFNRKVATGTYSFKLDIYVGLFYTVSCDHEDGTLQMKNGRPYNSYSDTYPNFFHFSGKCSSVPFRNMLRTGRPLCISA